MAVWALIHPPFQVRRLFAEEISASMVTVLRESLSGATLALKKR
jgi:hypothetical protein